MMTIPKAIELKETLKLNLKEGSTFGLAPLKLTTATKLMFSCSYLLVVIVEACLGRTMCIEFIMGNDVYGQKVINLMLGFRQEEYKRMMEHPNYTLGSVTTINMTKIEKYTLKAVTPLDESNPWWMTMKKVFDDLSLKYKTDMLGGGTDSRFLRERGHPALHFSPMIYTPQLLHDHNEFLNESVFLNGLKIYAKLIPALANLEGNQRDDDVDKLLGLPVPK